MAATVQLLGDDGTLLLDVSSYLRVADQDGMDPYPSFEEPGFNDAPLAEGAPLLNVDERNREQAFPLWVKGSSKDNLHAVLASLGRACQNCGRLAWQDDGATQVSYLDVTYARFDASYRYFPARKAWLAGVLRVYSAPPFAHTATERIVATTVNAAGLSPVAVATIPAGSIAGDVSALLKARVDSSGAAVGPLGRAAAIAALPSGYAPWIPAASMFSLHVNATLTGASGAPGSQVIAPATTSLRNTGALARLALAATPYAGRNRLLAVVRPARALGMLVAAGDQDGTPLAPTAVAAGLSGFGLADLGVANVPTSAATAVFTLAAGIPAQTGDDTVLRLGIGADSLGALAGVIVLPEEDITLAIDPGARIGGRWFAASGAAGSVPIALQTDDYGNVYNAAGGASAFNHGFFTASGLGGVSRPGGRLVLGAGAVAVRHRVIGIVAATGSGDPNLVAELDDTRGGGYIRGSYWQREPAAAGYLQVEWSTGAGGGTSALLSLPSQAGLWNNASRPLMLDVIRQGDQIAANLRILGGTGMLVTPSGAGGPTGVMVASVAVSAPAARDVQVDYAAFGVNNATGIILGHWVDRLQGQPVPSDSYVLDGAQGVSYRTPAAAGSAVLTMTDKLRGAPLRIDPQTAALAAFCAPLDGGAMNDPLGVEVRVRERFRWAR